jgi:hypothetical protein
MISSATPAGRRARSSRCPARPTCTAAAASRSGRTACSTSAWATPARRAIRKATDRI